MSEQAPTVNHEQLKLESALLDAQLATKEAGPTHLTQINEDNLLGEQTPDAPSVLVTKNEKFLRADVSKSGGPEGSNSKYHAVVSSDYEGNDTSFATVKRTAANGETYRHSFKNPDTARKMSSLMLRQVIRRAKQSVSNQELTKVG